jgi:hypothetical protein
MLTTLHLLLGQRRPHELLDNYLSQDHTLLLHKALLTWLITGTPPPLWELGCLNEDISPPPLASTGPYIRQSIAATIADPKGRYWRPTYPTPQIRDPPQRHPPTESHDKAHSTQGKTLPQPKGRPPVQSRGTSLDKNGGTALFLRECLQPLTQGGPQGSRHKRLKQSLKDCSPLTRGPTLDRYRQWRIPLLGRYPTPLMGPNSLFSP